MPPIFSRTRRACVMALSTMELQARPSLPPAQLRGPRNAGLGARRFGGFCGGTIPSPAAAAMFALAGTPPEPRTAAQARAIAPMLTASRRGVMSRHAIAAAACRATRQVAGGFRTAAGDKLGPMSEEH